MKKLHLIVESETGDISYELLKKSAENRGIEVNAVFPENFDFSQETNFGVEDGIYRISTNEKASLVEKFLINNFCASFYRDELLCIGKMDNVVESSLVQEKAGLPIIKTIFSITKNKELLKRYAEYLDGLPIVIKAMGGSHGVGVMKIDSMDSLFSVADYLQAQNQNFIMRKYIDYKEHARLIVLGNKVIASIEYKRVKGDFRSNVGEKLDIVPKNFADQINRIAVDSVKVLGYEFGGVDILIDKEGAPHIAEVNFPCFFPRTQIATGIDISGMMIDHLIKKAKKIKPNR